MKISHSASPRNRSSRSSRSPAAGSVIAGADVTGAASRAAATPASFGGAPSSRSAMDVISYRLGQLPSCEYGRTVRKDNIGPLVASNTEARTGATAARALGRNYVQTAIWPISPAIGSLRVFSYASPDKLEDR